MHHAAPPAAPAKETDPLLPSYAQAPEIIGSQHHHHHHHHHHYQPDPAELDPPAYPAVSPTWHNQRNDPHDVQRRRNRDGDEEESDAPVSVGDAMTRAMRSVFAIIIVCIFFGLILAVLNRNGLGRDDPPNWHPPLHTSPPSAPSTPSRTVEERVKNILASTPLIDGHDDLAIFIRGQYKNDITTHPFRTAFENGSMPLNVDLPRLRSGQNGGAFWSAFVLCPANASYDMTDSNYATAVSHTLEQIDLLTRLQEQYPRDFTPATSVHSSLTSSGREDMLLQWHATRSLFGPISIEGLHQIPPTAPLSTLRHYYALGVRMATLTWNCHNPFADASLVWNDFTDPPSVVNGVFRPAEGAVTKRGRAVLREMNRLGMIVDISHTSYWTQKAVLSQGAEKGEGHAASRAPAVFSHSSAYALCPHPRNVKDDILDLVPKSRSLVMVNFSPDFISCTAANESLPGSNSKEPHFALPTFYEKNNTLHQVARHIVYIGEKIGYDYVGLGSDFDGMGKLTPKGLEGVDKFPDLIAELLHMGVSDEDAKKVVGGNLLRVWKEVDEVAETMKKVGVEPGLDDADGY